MRGWASAVLLLSVLPACTGSLPLPPLGEHGDKVAQVVPSMPPPGKVEIVGSPPPELKHPVWIDGEWEWTGRLWAWKEKGWDEARPGWVYAPPITRRLADGRIVHLPGEWKKDEPAPR